MNMKKRSLLVLVVLVVLSSACWSVTTASAIGMWSKGVVTTQPWQEKFTYIKIDAVQYTIMKDTKVTYVYTKQGATYKDVIDLSGIRRGDTLLFKVSGHRIYQIEKLR